MAAWFIVRARVEDALLKDAFNRWYQDEHLPDALRGLIAEFDRVWGNKVTRSRDFVDVIQSLGD